MKRRRRASFKKEKAIMLVSSALVLTALTATGLYVRNRNVEKEDNNYVVDFTALEDQAKNAEKTGFEEQALEGELDYDPNYQEAGSGSVDNPNLTILGSKAGQASADTSQALNGQDSLAASDGSGLAAAGQPADAVNGGEALEANAGDAIVKNNEALKEAENPVSPQLSFHDDDALKWPIVGNVLVNFSMDKTVFFATLQQYKYSPAIVIAATAGEDISAAANGKVSSIYQDPEVGTAVVMDLGDGYEITYGQLTEIAVEEGDFVESGAVIGKAAEPTKYYSVEGCNVYFKLTKNGTPVNPLNRLS